MSGSGEKFDQGQNLAMWAEAPFTTPSALVLDPRVRWKPIDATSARLVVPFGEQEEESLRVEFDPETGLMKRMSGMRYRDQEETKTPWHGEYAEWRTVHGIKVPHRVVGAWKIGKSLTSSSISKARSTMWPSPRRSRTLDHRRMRLTPGMGGSHAPPRFGRNRAVRKEGE